MHFWTGVVTIAAALRRKVFIPQLQFTWTPNFYVVFVAPPGIVTKSTTIRIGLNLLDRVPGVRFGPQSMTWQALAESLEAAIEAVNIPNYGVTKMSCLTISVSELGTFLRTDDNDLVNFLTDLWDGQISEWRRTTKTAGSIAIKNPWLNIIGATTPSWMQTSFTGEMLNGGLASRIIFVYADRKRRFVAYPAEERRPEEWEKLGRSLHSDLCEIATIKGEYRLSPEAIEWGKDWYEKHWTMVANDSLAGWRARKHTHLHKLAMVLAASRRNDLTITLTDLQESAMILDDLETSLTSIFEAIGSPQEAHNIQTIASIVQQLPGVSHSDLWRLCYAKMDSRQFASALRGAVGAHLIAEKIEGTLVTFWPLATKQ